MLKDKNITIAITYGIASLSPEDRYRFCPVECVDPDPAIIIFARRFLSWLLPKK